MSHLTFRLGTSALALAVAVCPRIACGQLFDAPSLDAGPLRCEISGGPPQMPIDWSTCVSTPQSVVCEPIGFSVSPLQLDVQRGQYPISENPNPEFIHTDSGLAVNPNYTPWLPDPDTFGLTKLAVDKYQRAEDVKCPPGWAYLDEWAPSFALEQSRLRAAARSRTREESLESSTSVSIGIPELGLGAETGVSGRVSDSTRISSTRSASQLSRVGERRVYRNICEPPNPHFVRQQAHAELRLILKSFSND